VAKNRSIVNGDTPVAICTNLVNKLVGKGGCVIEAQCGHIVYMSEMRKPGHTCPGCGHTDNGLWRPSKISTVRDSMTQSRKGVMRSE
jgi:hypothetical protein